VHEQRTNTDELGDLERADQRIPEQGPADLLALMLLIDGEAGQQHDGHGVRAHVVDGRGDGTETAAAHSPDVDPYS
jgi:hypothetical protein